MGRSSCKKVCCEDTILTLKAMDLETTDTLPEKVFSKYSLNLVKVLVGLTQALCFICLALAALLLQPTCVFPAKQPEKAHFGDRNDEVQLVHIGTNELADGI